MNRWLRLIFHAPLVCGLVVASQAEAGLIYTSGPPNLASGNEMTQWIQADFFTLGASATIGSVEFFSLEQSTSYNGSITWAVYADAAGSPGALLDSGETAGVTRTDTGRNFGGGLEEFDNKFDVPAVSLGAGTYWLGLHNGPLTDQNRAEYYWETTDFRSPTGHELIAPFDGGWSDNGQSHAFSLFSGEHPVPEPSSLLSAGTAVLAGLALTGWRRRRALRSSH